MRKWQYSVLRLVAVILLSLAAIPALANIEAVVRTNTANVYAKATVFSSVLATVKKGHTLSVTAAHGAWVAVKSGGKEGFMLKRQLQKKSAGDDGKKKDNVTVLQMQKRLNEKGYLKSGHMTGTSNSATAKALRIFQMMNGLAVNSRPTDATLSRLFSGAARSMPSISAAPWKSCGVTRVFPRRGIALIIDMATGTRIHIRRVGGTEHLDVEPRAASDTAALKKACGTFSWDSRGVLLIAGGKCFAGAINTMPHGKQISDTNNYDGQFCLHLRDCQTHGTEKENPAHQTNVEKVYKYLTA